MSRGKQMKALQQMLEEKESQMNRLRIEIETLRTAMRLATGEPEPKVRTKRTNVKQLVLDLLREHAEDGLNAAKIVEIADRRGETVERGTVSSLLSRLKADGVVSYDNVMYRLAKSADPKGHDGGQFH